MDWRDFFNARVAHRVKLDQYRIAHYDRYPTQKEYWYMAMKFMVEACRDEAYLGAGGKSTDINLGPEHLAIKALRAVTAEAVFGDDEKMHYLHAALEALPPGIFKHQSEWTAAERARFFENSA